MGVGIATYGVYAPDARRSLARLSLLCRTLSMRFRLRAHLPDAAIMMTLFQRGWGVVAGLVMVLMTSTIFSRETQGFYYTFNSLIALQAFFELGLNFVLIQIVSHDYGHIGTDDADRDAAARDRVAMLFLSVRRWFLISAVLFALVVGLGGIAFLAMGQDNLSPGEWIPAWLLVAAAGAVNLYYSPQIAMAEGGGKVLAVARLRMIVSIVGYGACWLLLLVRPGLLPVACIGIASAIGSAWWVHRHSGMPELAAAAPKAATPYGWRKDILPLQWRVGLSWLSGYLLYQLFTPLTFAHRGATEAAMMGLSLSMFGNIALISMSWLSASTPALSGMVARGERTELRRRFRHLFVQSMGFQLLGAVGLCVVVGVGSHLELPVMDRFLPMADLALVALISCCNVAVFAFATFMRVHKEEPMTWNSLVCGLLIAASTYVTSFYGATWVLGCYLAIIAIISLPWSFILLRSYWRR